MANEKKIISRFQFRRDTTENWLLNKDTIPAAGEPCYDLDLKTLRIGDGVTPYEHLLVVGGGEGGDTSALQEAIDALQIKINEFQESMESVENNVSDLQDQVGETDISEVHENVSKIAESVSNLTDQVESEIDAIQENLNNKADVEYIEELQTTISQKADVIVVEQVQTELKTYVDEKIKIIKVEDIDYGEI